MRPHFIKIYALSLIIASAVFPIIGHSETIVPSWISSDQVWTKEKSPYVIRENVSFGEGVSLTILSGAKVVFEEPHTVELVSSSLRISGTREQPVEINKGGFTLKNTDKSNSVEISFSKMEEVFLYWENEPAPGSIFIENSSLGGVRCVSHEECNINDFLILSSRVKDIDFYQGFSGKGFKIEDGTFGEFSHRQGQMTMRNSKFKSMRLTPSTPSLAQLKMSETTFSTLIFDANKVALVRSRGELVEGSVPKLGLIEISDSMLETANIDGGTVLKHNSIKTLSIVAKRGPGAQYTVERNNISRLNLGFSEGRLKIVNNNIVPRQDIFDFSVRTGCSGAVSIPMMGNYWGPRATQRMEWLGPDQNIDEFWDQRDSSPNNCIINYSDWLPDQVIDAGPR
ncbi:MAG: hypothetical protein AB7T49_14500 [Oligoflexales bacterium]